MTEYQQRVEEEAKEWISYYSDEIVNSIYESFCCSTQLSDYQNGEDRIYQYPVVSHHQDAYNLLVELEGDYSKYDFSNIDDKKQSFLDYLADCANAAFYVIVERTVSEYLEKINKEDWDVFIKELAIEDIQEDKLLSDEESQRMIDFIEPLHFVSGSEFVELVNSINYAVLEQEIRDNIRDRIQEVVD